MQPASAEIVTFSISSAKFSLHEPVAIDFAVKNNFSETITFDLGPDRKGNFKFGLTRPNGASNQARLIPEGFVMIGKITIRPGEFYRQRLLINEWFDLSQIGNYAISVDLLATIQSGNGRIVAKGANFRTTFEITSRDPKKLQEVCANLFDQIASSKTLEQALPDAVELSLVQDSVAVPFLEKTIELNKVMERTAIEGLGRVGDAEAVQALIRTLSKKNKDAEITIFVRRALSRIESGTTDPAVKRQIRSALGK